MTEMTATNAIVHALQLLAADPDQQLAAFPRFVHVPDELALTFDDAIRVLRDRAEEESFPPEILQGLEELDGCMDDMTSRGRDTLWTEAALRSSTPWASLRRDARRILASLGIERIASPQADSIYVPDRRPRS